MTNRLVAPVLALLLAAPLCASASAAEAAPDALQAQCGTRNGREIYQSFRAGLADPNCKADASARWQAHFAHAPRQLATRNDDVLPLFGYVVDAVRAANLPTEFALIPFVESGYKPGARSTQGPAGLWQMIAITARNHNVPMRAGYDGRLSPVDSTAAAVRYLKTLYGMFAGDWRLAVMAYNAGEYRVLGALKRAGQTARNARPETLPGLSPITHAYVRKLHALSCLLEQADDRDEWLQALDRPVPALTAIALPADIPDIAAWARQSGQDADRLRRLNPAFAGGRITRGNGKPARLLAVAMDTTPAATGAVDMVAPERTPDAMAVAGSPTMPAAGPLPAEGTPQTPATTARRHTVVRGDNPSKIAARYGVRVADLLQRNGLHSGNVLRPGTVLLLDAEIAAGDTPAASAGTP
jgi:membrane-bound lytic murein transglycosylase D